MTHIIMRSPTRTAKFWADKVRQHLGNAVEDIIAAGQAFIDAKAELPHGEFGRVAELAGVTDRTVRMLMEIARNPVLSNRNHGSDLPSSWRTLAELARLDPEDLQAHIDDGTITPDTTRRDAAALRPTPPAPPAPPPVDDPWFDEPLPGIAPAPMPAPVPVDPWTDEERDIQRHIEGGQAVAVNIRHHPNLIAWAQAHELYERIDRQTRWGNPFIIGDDGDRDAVCDKYRDHYLPHKPSLQQHIPELAGKALGCWCAPERCHGEWLARLANGGAT